MATLPKMSAPIGRVRIKTGKKSASGDRWRSADPAVDSEATDLEEMHGDERRPRFYPFPLPSAVEADD
ncbi:MAG: hypothetical protein OEM15_17530 [Myxococcales bacterium]|nr:hypothetical protein [Myxococcales bacterium]